MFSKEEIITKLQEYFERKAGDYAVEVAFLFGSQARGMPKTESDVDIAVSFAKDLDDEDKIFDSIAIMAVEIASLIKKEVEIIPLRKDFRKPALYYNAIVLGKPIFIGNRNRYIQLYNQALFEMNDFELFGLGWQFKASGSILGRITHG